MRCRTRRGTVTIPERQLRAMYARAEADRRRYEPQERRISFAAFKRLVCIQLQMSSTDPGGNIIL